MSMHTEYSKNVIQPKMIHLYAIYFFLLIFSQFIKIFRKTISMGLRKYITKYVALWISHK